MPRITNHLACESDFPLDAYQLIDFGNGRKLERFGELVLDRPSPAAQDVAPQFPNAWPSADVHWPDRISETATEPWNISFRCASSELRFKLKLTPFGHVGLFPEQAENWRWLYQRVSDVPTQKLRALNLFAYTGGATLAMAAAGAEVVHVDSSSPAVAWARENAALSKLEDKPIRWIVEDAFKFVQRELRRRNAYDIIVLDPPSYGHTPSGKPWRLGDRWRELLGGCMNLLRDNPQASLLWTGHSPTPTMNELREQATSGVGFQPAVESGRSRLIASTGKPLDTGYYLRFAQTKPGT